MVESTTILALVGVSVLILAAGAFLGIGFVLALLSTFLALTAALLSNVWRILNGTLQSLFKFFTFPFALKWAFMAFTIIFVVGLSVVEFQNETMQKLDVFYECFVYDTIDRFVDRFAIPFRDLYNFVIPRWNDLILYLRDCIEVLLDEFPDIFVLSFPTRTEIVEAICSIVNFGVCVILAPVSIESWEIPFFTNVLREFIDIIICLIQLAKEFLTAIILDPLDFFNGPCFVILQKGIECLRLWLLYITASGFNGLLDDFINDTVDNIECYLLWGKLVAINIATLELFNTWPVRGREFCICLGDTFQLATGGLLPGIGDWIECICVWFIDTLELVFRGLLPTRIDFVIRQLCDCIEDHLRPLFDPILNPVFTILWKNLIDLVICNCDFIANVLRAAFRLEIISGDCYMCQRCPTCKVSAASISDNCALSQQDVGVPILILLHPFAYSKCAGSPFLESCSDCCDRCQQYCDCSNCHDFVDEFISCWCIYIERIAFEFLDQIPFGIDFGDIFLLACDVLIKVLNLWRPIVRAVMEFGLCKTSDIFDGVQEILFTLLEILDCSVIFISMGEDCEAFSPIPIPAFIPIPSGICDNFIFVLFLQLLQFILDILFGLGIQDIIEAIICIVTTTYDVCISSFPTGQSTQCDLSGCWDALAMCITNIGGIWSPIIEPVSPLFTNLSAVFNIVDFVLCPVRDLIDCWVAFVFQGVVNFGTLDNIVTGLRNALICSATIPVGTGTISFPFASFTSIINPLLDLYNVFLVNVPSTPFGETRLTSFNSFFNFLNGLLSVQWVGLPLFRPWLLFIIRPAFDIFNCFMSSFNEIIDTFNNVDNVPTNILLITQVIINFLDCVRSIAVNGQFVFRPLIEIILFPLVFLLRAVISIVNPRPVSFIDVVNRLIQMCTNLSLVTFGSDSVSIMRWVFDYFGMLKRAIKCIFDQIPPPNDAFISKMIFLGGNSNFGLNCLQEVSYNSPGIASIKPFFNFLNPIFAIIQFLRETLLYFIFLFSWIGCLSEIGGCCSNPVTSTSEFISEVEELIEAVDCLFTEFPPIFDIPCLPDGTCKRDTVTPEQAQEQLDKFRITWDNFLSYNMSIPRNSSCGESLYGKTPGDINITENWIEASRYFVCIGMLRIGDRMIKRNPNLTHSDFDCPTRTLQTIHDQVLLFGINDGEEEEEEEGEEEEEEEGQSKRDVNQRSVVPEEGQENVQEQTTFKTFLDQKNNEYDDYEFEEEESEPLTTWKEMYEDQPEYETPEWIEQLFNTTAFTMIKEDYEKLKTISESGEIVNSTTGRNYTKEELISLVWGRILKYKEKYEEWREHQDTVVGNGTFKDFKQRIEEYYNNTTLAAAKTAADKNKTAEEKRTELRNRLTLESELEHQRRLANKDPNRKSLQFRWRKRASDHFLLGIRDRPRKEISYELHRKLLGIPKLPPRKRGSRYNMFLLRPFEFEEYFHSYVTVRDYYEIIKKQKRENGGDRVLYDDLDEEIRYITSTERLLPSSTEPFNYNVEALEFFDTLWDFFFNQQNFWSDIVDKVTVDLDFTKDIVEPIVNFMFGIISCDVPEDFDGTNFYNTFCFPLLPETIFDWIQPLPTNILRVQIPWPKAIISVDCEGQEDGDNCPSDGQCNRPMCPACDYGEREYDSCRDDLQWVDAFDNIFYFFNGIPRWWDSVFIHDDDDETAESSFFRTLIVFPFIFIIPGVFGVFTFPITIPFVTTFTFYFPYYTPYLWILAGWGLSFAFKFPSIASFNFSKFITDLVNNFSFIIDLIGTFFGLDITQYLLIKAQKVAYPIGEALPTVETFCFYWTLSNFGFGFLTLVLGYFIVFLLANAIASLLLFLFAIVASLGLLIQSAIIRVMQTKISDLEVDATVSRSIFRQMLTGGGRPALAIARSIGVHMSDDQVLILNRGTPTNNINNVQPSTNLRTYVQNIQQQLFSQQPRQHISAATVVNIHNN